LVMRRGEDVLDLRPLTVHQFLKAFNCRGVVCLNSNVAHDALIWNRAVVALEEGSWPTWLFPSELPEDWDAFEGAERNRQDKRHRYVAQLMARQWTPEDAQDEERVQSLLEEMCTTR